MSIGLKCTQCEWKSEEADNTPVVELPVICPICRDTVQAYAIAHWMRDMHPDL